MTSAGLWKMTDIPACMTDPRVPAFRTLFRERKLYRPGTSVVPDYASPVPQV